MLETKKGNHTVYRIAYHLCWIPKYRRKVFTAEKQKKLKEILVGISYEYEWEVGEIEVMSDHVHILISTNPAWSPAKIVQILKSKSAIGFFREYPEVREKYFWGGRLWTSSYFVETVGNSSHERIREYIKNQEAEMERKLQEMKLF